MRGWLEESEWVVTHPHYHLIERTSGQSTGGLGVGVGWSVKESAARVYVWTIGDATGKQKASLASMGVTQIGSELTIPRALQVGFPSEAKAISNSLRKFGVWHLKGDRPAWILPEPSKTLGIELVTTEEQRKFCSVLIGSELSVNHIPYDNAFLREYSVRARR